MKLDGNNSISVGLQIGAGGTRVIWDLVSLLAHIQEQTNVNLSYQTEVPLMNLLCPSILLSRNMEWYSATYPARQSRDGVSMMM